MIQLSHPYMTTGKTIALTRWTFVGRVMSLLFNMLSRLVIAFLPRVALVVKKKKKKKTCQYRRCKTRGFDPWVGKMPWRRKWLPTPVFLSRESYGQRSLAGYSPQGCKELDRTEGLTLSLSLFSSEMVL